MIVKLKTGEQIIQQFDISSGKPGQITVSSKDLETGVYLYGIEFNDKIVKSNKMMVIK